MVQQKILLMKINNKGFNLLMLCVVIMALSILMSSVLGFYNVTNYKRRLQTTNERFQAIDLAIKNYIFKEHRFPCPAPLNCNTGGCKTFGDSLGISRSVDDDGNCVVGDSQNGVFKSTNSETSKEIYYGGVPAITLGLDNSHIIDGWGNKIVYIIPKELTAKGSDKIFYYAKNHEIDPDNRDITVGNRKITLDKKYVKDGIVYLLISFNVNKQGAYAYKNTKVNHFSNSDKKNFPVEDFEIDTSVDGLLFFKRNIHNFSVGKIEEQIQVCPEIKYNNLTFKSAEYGEIRFSDEMCPSPLLNDHKEVIDYYLSNYRNNQGTLIENKAAIRCGKNGEWETGELKQIFKCEKLPKCSAPQNADNYNWDDHAFPVVNMSIVEGTDKNNANNKIQLICVCTYDPEHTYNYTYPTGSQTSHYNCKTYEIELTNANP